MRNNLSFLTARWPTVNISALVMIVGDIWVDGGGPTSTFPCPRGELLAAVIPHRNSETLAISCVEKHGISTFLDKDTCESVVEPVSSQSGDVYALDVRWMESGKR